MKKFISVFLIVISLVYQFSFAFADEFYTVNNNEKKEKIKFRVKENHYKKNTLVKENIENNVYPLKEQKADSYIKEMVREEAPSAAEEGILKRTGRYIGITGKYIGAAILLPIALPIAILFLVIGIPILYYSSPSPNPGSNNNMDKYIPPKINYDDLKPENKQPVE